MLAVLCLGLLIAFVGSSSLDVAVIAGAVREEVAELGIAGVAPAFGSEGAAG